MPSTKSLRLFAVLLSCGVGQCTAASAAEPGASGPALRRIVKPLNIYPPTVLPNTCKLDSLLEENNDQKTKGKYSAQLDVGIDGTVLGIMIYKTTGNAKLDSVSLSALQSCRFSPGSEEGKAARATALLEIEWDPGVKPKIFAVDIYAPWRRQP